jgi:hypothetical protein
MGSMTRRLGTRPENERNLRLVGATGSLGRMRFRAGVIGAQALNDGMRSASGGVYLVESLTRFLGRARDWSRVLRRGYPRDWTIDMILRDQAELELGGAGA